MKDETKKKLCKISKIVGFAITFGFAVFGVLCAAMLIGNGSKKDDIKTLDSSLVLNEVRSERNIKPRKAPDLGDSVNLFDNPDYVEDGCYAYSTYMDGASSSFDPYSVYVLELSAGYYYLKFPNPSSYISGYLFNQSLTNVKSALALSQLGRFDYPDGWQVSTIVGSNTSSYFYCSGGVCTFSGYRNNLLGLYLVDTLGLPAQNLVSFPNNWSPMALISDNLSVKGGYAFVDVSPATYETLVPINITLKQNLFRYDGKVYDEMVFTFVDLSHGDGYIQDDGQPWKPWEKTTAELSSSLHVFGLYSLRFNSSFRGESIVALSPIYSDSPFQTGGDGTYYPPTVYLPTGEYRWVNPKVTYIEVIDYSFGSGSTRFDGRYFDYSDLALLTYLNGYVSEGNYLAIGASGGVFDLMSGAFNGLLPILSVQILPNITLGILLFLPLIGGIIVIIIRVIKK